MRRKQAVILLIGACLLGTLSIGAHRAALPDDPVVVGASTLSSHNYMVDRIAPLEVTRSESRPPVQLHRGPKAPVRTVVHHTVRPTRHFSPHLAYYSGAESWAASEHVRRLRECESGDVPTVVSTHNGVTYYGLYQMDRDFWTTYGGDPSYLGSPFRAPRWLQNEVAYRGFLARGFEPWACG